MRRFGESNNSLASDPLTNRRLVGSLDSRFLSQSSYILILFLLREGGLESEVGRQWE